MVFIVSDNRKIIIFGFLFFKVEIYIIFIIKFNLKNVLFFGYVLI